MNGLKALIQLLIYMLNIPKENNVFTETTSCSDKKKKKIQSSLSQMQGHYFHQTMTVILCVSGVPDHQEILEQWERDGLGVASSLWKHLQKHSAVPNGLKANGYSTATMKRNISIWMCLLVKQMFTTENSIWVVRTLSNNVCIYRRIKYSFSL